MSKKKLAQETRNAAEEERERRKRVQKKRQEVTMVRWVREGGRTGCSHAHFGGDRKSVV